MTSSPWPPNSTCASRNASVSWSPAAAPTWLLVLLRTVHGVKGINAKARCSLLDELVRSNEFTVVPQAVCFCSFITADCPKMLEKTLFFFKSTFPKAKKKFIASICGMCWTNTEIPPHLLLACFYEFNLSWVKVNGSLQTKSGYLAALFASWRILHWTHATSDFVSAVVNSSFTSPLPRPGKFIQMCKEKRKRKKKSNSYAKGLKTAYVQRKVLHLSGHV